MSKLEQTLKYIRRHKHTDDLHSFKVFIEDGVAFVSYKDDKYNVLAFKDVKGYEAQFEYSYKTLEECAGCLKILDAKPETIEM